MNKLKADMGLGNNLRKLRKENGLKQNQVIAQMYSLNVDITRSTYARLETGELNIPVQVLLALHRIYQCSFDAFFEGLELKPFDEKSTPLE